MAKNMARVYDGVVLNVVWCTDTQPETETLVATSNRSVTAGDTYSDGKFYRDGEEILTPLEEALKENAEYKNLIASLSEVYEDADS